MRATATGSPGRVQEKRHLLVSCVFSFVLISCLAAFAADEWPITDVSPDSRIDNTPRSVFLAGDEKKENQSVFVTADGKRVSSSAFIKMIRKKLVNFYQDLELVIITCHSGEFVTRAGDATNGLMGNWSVSTSSAKDKGTTDARSSRDEDIPQGPDGTIAGFHYGERWYHGYWAQYIKKLTATPNASNMTLHQTAKANNYRPNQLPQYGSSGATADNMTVHGGTTGNLAILFCKPQGYVQLGVAHYEALRAAGYTDGGIEYLRGNDAGMGIVDRNAKLQDLEEALDDLGLILFQYAGDIKAYILIESHGGYQSRVVEYAANHISGVPGNGRIWEFPQGTATVEVDATLLEILMEDTPRTGGGIWHDDPAVQRQSAPVFSLATSSESVSGSPTAGVYLNDLFLGTLSFNNSSSGGEYSLPIPDSLLDALIPGLMNNPDLTIRLDFSSPGASITLATDDDFWLDPDYSALDYGISVTGVLTGEETLQPPAVPAASGWGFIVLCLGIMVSSTLVYRLRCAASNPTSS